MNQILTSVNPTRSMLLKRAVDTQLLYCLKMTQTDGDTEASKSTIIFPNMEYDITFFDITYAKLYYITALVEDVYEDQIKVKYLRNSGTGNSTKDYTSALQGAINCNCILSTPDLSKYEGPYTFFIPINNIVNVGYRWSSNNSSIKDTSEVRIMLLGISATAVKAIIIRMAFFEDSLEEAVKLVELKAGNIYDIVHESDNGAIYETRIKVMNIEECPDKSTTTGKGFVREHVGMGNSVYTNCCVSKDEFMTAPPAPKIRIIADTSESFTGRYEAFMLDSIRDCTLVFEGEGDNNDEFDKETDSYCMSCGFYCASCHPDHCGHYVPNLPSHGGHGGHPPMPPQTFVYTYDGMCKATVTGDKVQIMANGKVSDVNLEDILKYYLGVG